MHLHFQLWESDDQPGNFGLLNFQKRAYPKKVRRFAALLLPSADGYGIMGDTWYHRYP
jgi:hypothetical protein